MSKKVVIRADLVGKKCKREILSIVARLEGIKSMDIDPEKCTLTVVGTVDPVCVVQVLRKERFAAAIVSVEDDKPKEEKTPCQEACEKACKEKCEKACQEKCEKACKDKCCCDKGGYVPSCCDKRGYVPSCYYYGGPAMGYSYY